MKIEDYELQRALEKALDGEVRSVLSRDTYGVGLRLKELAAKAVENNAKNIAAAMDTAIKAALRSPAFMESLEKEILSSLRGKFTGAFAGVMGAAGKKAAQDQLRSQEIAQAVARQLAGNPAAASD